MPKVYLHYDGERGPDHTFMWKGGAPGVSRITGLSLAQALAAFVSSYQNKHGLEAYDGGRGMNASKMRLVAEDPSGGRRVELDIASDECVDSELVYNGCDLVVTEEVRQPDAVDDVTETRNGVDSYPLEVGKLCDYPGAMPCAVTGDTGRAVGRGTGVFREGIVRESPPAVSKLLGRAQKLAAARRLHEARDVLREVLTLDPRNGAALRCLAGVYTDAGMHDHAFEAAKEACSSARDSGPADLLLAGRCLVKLGRYTEAREAIARSRLGATGDVADDADAHLALCYIHMGDVPRAADMYMEVLERTKEEHVEALVGYGRLAVALDQVDKGLPSLLKAIVINQGHKGCKEALAEVFGLEEGIRVLKEQVAPVPATSSVYAFLASVAKDYGQIDASVELLQVAMSIEPTSGSIALALVHGHEIRDDYPSALAAADAFLRRNPSARVGRRGPRSSEVLSVLNDPLSSYDDALKPRGSREEHPRVRWIETMGIDADGSMSSRQSTVSFAWVSSSASPKSPSSSMDATADASSRTAGSPAVPQGGGAQANRAVSEQSGYGEGERSVSSPYPRSCPSDGAGSRETDAAFSTALSGGCPGASTEVPCEKRGVFSLGGEGEAVLRGWMEAGAETYTPEDLDLLALFFTLTKMLYVLGDLPRLPLLVRLLEPARVRSSTALHRTPIRNEQAYHCCVAQLLSHAGGGLLPFRHPERSSGRSDPRFPSKKVGSTAPGFAPVCNPTPGATGGMLPSCGERGRGNSMEAALDETVYVCGDSHTLTTAWRQLMVGGRRRVLRPALVTGLKHWHLRPESSFYPKRNFERVVEKIPEGSAVIFVFGEIDCREGILVAVEKMRYASVEEGMEHTVGIFVEVAEQLVRKRRIRGFIHPVVPVLDETRAMVKAYNGVFRRKVDASGLLSWLDFFEGLLDASGNELRQEYCLDGTHLGPSYLLLLEKALNDVWREQAYSKVLW